MRYCANESIRIYDIWDSCIYYIYEFLGDINMNKDWIDDFGVFVTLLSDIMSVIIKISLSMDVIMIWLYSGIQLYFFLIEKLTGSVTRFETPELPQAIAVLTSALVVSIAVVLTFNFIHKLFYCCYYAIKWVYDFFTGDENYED